MEFDESLVDEFVMEAKEHIETVEADLVALETSSEEIDSDLVNRLFRAVHSVKGGAGFLGFDKLKEISHTAETVLSLVRSGDIKPTPETVDSLLRTIDVVGSMLDDISQSNSVDISALTVELKEIIAKESSTEVQQELKTVVEVPEAGGRLSGFTVNRFKLKESVGNGTNLLIVKVDLREVAEKGGKSPVAMIREIVNAGELVESKVTSQLTDLRSDLSAASVVYEILLFSKETAESLKKQLPFPVKEVVTVDADELVSSESESGKESQGKEEKEDESFSIEDALALIKEEEKPVVAVALEEEVKSVVPVDTAPLQISKKKEKKQGTDTIRIKLNTLDELMRLAGEMVLIRNQQLLSVDTSDAVAVGNAQRLDIVTTELQGTIMETRMQPIGNLFSRFTRVVRDLSRTLGKSVEIQVTGSEVELDNTILEALSDPMTHLVRNSCDHGLELPQDRVKAGKSETGVISLSAAHESGHIHVKIEDNGRGVNMEAVKKSAVEKGLKTEKEIALLKEKEIVSLILLPGFSTAKEVSDLSGRGVGMDVVNSAIEKLGGTLEIDSVHGKGTSISMRLPLTLAIIPCLIVVVGDHRYAIPQVNLEELVCLYDEDVLCKIECAGNQEVYRLRDELLPMVRFSEVLNRKEPFSETFSAELTEKYRKEREELRRKAGDAGDGEPPESHFTGSLNFAVLNVGATRFGLIVDCVIGTEEIVVKPMHPTLNALKCYSGATVMGDGRVAMILDIQGIVKHIGLDSVQQESNKEVVSRQGVSSENQSVLLFKSGKSEQFALPLPLIKHIENIRLSELEKVGDKEYATINGVSTLIIRLDHYLKVSEAVESEEMYLILPKFVRQSVGFIVSSLVGTTDVELNLNVDGYMEEGLFGTSIISEKMTLFPDIPTVLKKARPDWFTREGDSEHGGERSRILLVENATYYQNLIKGYLESQGYEVVTAENGEEGLEKIRGDKFDCVLSELAMPGMDGFSFLKNLRSGKEQNDIPVICLSSGDSSQERRKAEERGFDRYEIKMDTGHLLSTVSEIVGSH